MRTEFISELEKLWRESVSLDFGRKKAVEERRDHARDPEASSATEPQLTAHASLLQRIIDS